MLSLCYKWFYQFKKKHIIDYIMAAATTKLMYGHLEVLKYIWFIVNLSWLNFVWELLSALIPPFFKVQKVTKKKVLMLNY